MTLSGYEYCGAAQDLHGRRAHPAAHEMTKRNGAMPPRPLHPRSNLRKAQTPSKLDRYSHEGTMYNGVKLVPIETRSLRIVDTQSTVTQRAGVGETVTDANVKIVGTNYIPGKLTT